MHSDLVQEFKQRTQAEVRFDRVSRMLYATDASNYQIMPIGVVLPRTEEDLAAIVEICASHKVPMLPRGGGSSLAGQTVGEAVIIDTSKYLRQVKEVNPETQQVRVQPGLTIGALNTQLKSYGLMIGPDPASGERACVGGSIGNNSTGAHSLLYGMFADQLISLKTYLADGQQVSFGPGEGTGRAADLYNQVCRIITANEAEIRAHWPRHWRRASGYNLNYMLPDAPLRHPHPIGPAHHPSLAHLICGSEGTLAVIAEATLNLVPRPKMTALAVIQFNNIITSMEATNVILELEPSAVEVMDRMLIDLARTQPQYSRMLTFIEGDPEAVLAVEFEGETEAELVAHLDRLEKHLIRHQFGDHFLRAMSAQAQADVWGVRKVGLGLLMSMRGDYKPIPVLEDVAVPAETLPHYVADIINLADRYQTKAAVYAHASVGCLHVRPAINLKSAQGVQMMKEMGDAALELAVKYGGVTSGEHGDGLQRSYHNQNLFGATLYRAMQQVKEVFDPQHLLNPGKVVEAPDPTQNLRYGADYAAIPLKPMLDWSHEGGLDRAVEMCNGAGVCRKLKAGTMCPSYMATQDERDTTRARANTFRALLSGTLPLEALTDEDVHEVFELCIGCKACKSECPSSVDMARIKTEYKAQYYARKRPPLRDRLIGNVPRLSKWVAAVPGAAMIVNAMLGSPLNKWVMKRLGIAAQREFPRFARRTFSDRFKQSASSRISRTKKVLLFNDTWTEYNYPEIGQAAVKVLEAAGYQVVLETNRQCCGRPLLTTGLVEPVKAMACKNVDLLQSYVEAGIPIVGLEPSCILSFRDEYPALVDDSRRELAQRLGQNCFTIDEFLYQLMETETANFGPAQFQQQNIEVLFHGHCHQKALSNIKKSLAVLKTAGYIVQEIPSGCCGMAGNFGYEAEHYPISEAISRDRLIPAIEAQPDLPIVANGISCRDQIEHFTGRRPRHFIEYLADAVK